MIQKVYLKSNCLAAQRRFLKFKGPGFFKIILKIGGMIEDYKASDIRLRHLRPTSPAKTVPLETYIGINLNKVHYC